MGRMRGPSPANYFGAVPIPRGHVAEQVVAGQVEVERGDGDVALAEAGDVGLGAFEVVGGVVGHPVVGPAARVLPALEALAVAADAHRHDADALGLAPRVGRAG